jgi:hypothetical protein
MGPKGSQELATGHYPDPVESSLQLTFNISKIQFNIYSIYI